MFSIIIAWKVHSELCWDSAILRKASAHVLDSNGIFFPVAYNGCIRQRHQNRQMNRKLFSDHLRRERMTKSSFIRCIRRPTIWRRQHRKDPLTVKTQLAPNTDNPSTKQHMPSSEFETTTLGLSYRLRWHACSKQADANAWNACLLLLTALIGASLASITVPLLSSTLEFNTSLMAWLVD